MCTMSIMLRWCAVSGALMLLVPSSLGLNTADPMVTYFRQDDKIELFQTQLTSPDMVVPKNPLSKYIVQCPSSRASHFKLSTLQRLSGERIFPSSYVFDFKEEGKDVPGCNPVVRSRSLERLSKYVNEGYRVHLMLPDGLRIQTVASLKNGKVTGPVQSGLPIGYTINDSIYTVTNWKFYIRRTPYFQVHDKKKDKKDLVNAFHAISFYAVAGNTVALKSLAVGQKVSITYSLHVFEDDTPGRYEGRDEFNNDQLESKEKTMFFILWSLFGTVCVLLGTMLWAFIMLRTVYRDISIADKEIEEFLISNEDKIIELGWKFVHADVFRAPSNPMLLCATLGFGIQVTITVLLSVITLWANKATIGFCIFVNSNAFGAYVSSRFYKTFGGARWKLNVLITFILYPVVILLFLAVAEVCMVASTERIKWRDGDYIVKYSGALPTATVAAALAIWIGVGFPLALVGAYFGYRRDAYDYPVRTNLIPRQIPTQSLMNRLLPRSIFYGFVIFLSFLLQIYFINGVLLEGDRPVYGNVILVFACILSMICSMECGLISTYRQLSSENYHWWWQSMVVTGASGMWTAGSLCVIWFIKYFNHYTAATDAAINAIVFFCVVVAVSMTVALMNASLGFIASWLLVRKIYGSIKID